VISKEKKGLHQKLQSIFKMTIGYRPVNRERGTFPVTFEAKTTVTFKLLRNVELVPFQRNELGDEFLFKGSGGAPLEAQALVTQQRTFCSHFKCVFKQKFRPNYA